MENPNSDWIQPVDTVVDRSGSKYGNEFIEPRNDGCQARGILYEVNKIP